MDEPKTEPDMDAWVQVEAEHHYDPMRYLHPNRMASIGYQFRLCHSHFPGAALLEVGAGAFVCAVILRKLGHTVKTLDVDEKLKPDILGSVTDIPCDNAAFDAFMCCQVLEHLRWEQVDAALAELRRTTSQGGVLSVPTVRPTWALIKFDSRSAGSRRIHTGLRSRRPMRNRTNEHHWELEANVRSDDFREKVRAAGFRIVEEVRPIEWLYHHFFVVKPQA